MPPWVKPTVRQLSPETIARLRKLLRRTPTLRTAAYKLIVAAMMWDVAGHVWGLW